MTVSNDSGKFERCFRDISSPELELKKENDIHTEGSFLDLGIKMKGFTLSLNGKRNDFPFPDVKMLYLLSIIVSKIFILHLKQKARAANTHNYFRTFPMLC